PIAFCLAEMIKNTTKNRWIKFLGFLLICANLIEPTVNAVKHIFVPAKREEMNKVMVYIKEHRENDDSFYIYAHAMKSFSYYWNLNKVEIERLTISPSKSDSSTEKIESEMQNLSGRVWIVFGHAKQSKGVDYESQYLAAADRYGRRIDQYIDIGASTYLYEFPTRKPAAIQ
ncbi:MAG: hypothetical protein WAU91_09425, partial [Desulfatitalea sp.]